MTFQLDTTGVVKSPTGVWQHPTSKGGALTALRWSDLSPFVQGYIEAFLASGPLQIPYEAPTRPGIKPMWTVRDVAFRDLAPETLARIIADCEAYQAAHHSALEGLDGPRRPDSTRQKDGAMFWHWRNKPGAISFLPLTVQLGGDGKVRLA